MFGKLRSVVEKYEKLQGLLSDPKVYGNQQEMMKYSKEQAEISGVVEKYREYQDVDKAIAEAEEIINDKKTDQDFKELAQAELEDLREKKTFLEQDLKLLLVPKDPNDEKNIFLEIRAGTGGDEAALFGADLYRMYTKYAEKRHWKVEVISSSLTGGGGLKEIIAMISGKAVYSRLKYESGVHRVQRVPDTESSGGSIPPPRLSPYSRRRRRRTCISTRKTSAWTSSARRGRAASALIPPIRRCALPTCRRALSSPARTREAR